MRGAFRTTLPLNRKHGPQTDPSVNRMQHVAITRTGSSSHYEIACGTGTHFVWVRFGNAGLSYDADDTKWVPLCQMGSESQYPVPNGFIL